MIHCTADVLMTPSEFLSKLQRCAAWAYCGIVGEYLHDRRGSTEDWQTQWIHNSPLFKGGLVAARERELMSDDGAMSEDTFADPLIMGTQVGVAVWTRVKQLVGLGVLPPRLPAAVDEV